MSRVEIRKRRDGHPGHFMSRGELIKLIAIAQGVIESEIEAILHSGPSNAPKARLKALCVTSTVAESLLEFLNPLDRTLDKQTPSVVE